jgi:hypothetical protein
MRKRLCTSFISRYFGLVWLLVRTGGSPRSSASVNALLFSCHLLPLPLTTQVIELLFSIMNFFPVCHKMNDLSGKKDMFM